MSDDDASVAASVASTFSSRIDNVKTITDILSCLCVDLHKDIPCHVEATAEGLTFIVSGRSKSTQARITLQAGLFERYEIEFPVRETRKRRRTAAQQQQQPQQQGEEEERQQESESQEDGNLEADPSKSIKFVLNLTVLVDCLHIFGSSSDTVAATMSFSTEDAQLRLSLEESGVVTTCDINSLYLDDYDDLQQGLLMAFREHPEDCQIIIKSDALKEAIHELAESNWANSVRFEVTPTSVPTPHMKLSTGGVGGVTEINFPRTCDAFVSFRCNNIVCSTYPLKSLLLGMKALTVAKETYIRVNSAGLACVQHQIETAKGQETYFDFLMVAEETAAVED